MAHEDHIHSPFGLRAIAVCLVLTSLAGLILEVRWVGLSLEIRSAYQSFPQLVARHLLLVTATLGLIVTGVGAWCGSMSAIRWLRIVYILQLISFSLLGISYQLNSGPFVNLQIGTEMGWEMGLGFSNVIGFGDDQTSFLRVNLFAAAVLVYLTSFFNEHSRSAPDDETLTRIRRFLRENK